MILWGWPGVIGVFKPAYASFALAGGRRRAWGIGLATVTALSIPFVATGAWGQYATAVTSWDLPWYRAAFNIPLLLIPVVAWAGRRTDPLSSASLRGSPG